MKSYVVGLLWSLACVAATSDPHVAKLIQAARELARQPGGAFKGDEMLAQAAALDPTSGEAQMYRANIEGFIVKQDMERAIGLYRESIAADNGTRWEAHYFLGKLLHGEGRHAEAAGALRAAAKLVPTNGAVLNELGSVQARLVLPLDAHGNAAALPEDEQLLAVMAKNAQEHDVESSSSCAAFYCGQSDASGVSHVALSETDAYSMGPVPSNDFPRAFAGGAGDNEQIFVSKQPLFSAEECLRVIELAEEEGRGLPPATSGKYQIGRAWVKEMPSVLEWFNEALRTRLFPALMYNFGDLISGAEALRAHTVLIAKYNATDGTAQSDVHVDDALLALTIALSPPEDFTGGGTYFEHLNTTVDMGQGHVTLRPGSVRHAGAPIESGVRYVLGGFIAIDDKVEHVRRLVERGNRILMLVDAGAAGEEHMEYAAQLFQWGLELNANCTLCHQSLGDVFLRLGKLGEAETALRAQIELLPSEADGHFALGVALRRQGRDSAAVDAFSTAVALAPGDAEGWVNLGGALGALGEHSREADAYRTALRLKPEDAKVWINLGGVLASNLVQPEQALEAYRCAASQYAREGEMTAIATHFEMAAKALTRPAHAAIRTTLERIATGARHQSSSADAPSALRDHAQGCGDVWDANCAELVAVADAAQPRACLQSWEQHYGNETQPPTGFDSAARLMDTCAVACAADALELSSLPVDVTAAARHV